MEDITISCRARRTRHTSPSPMDDLIHVPSHATILTLCHWMQTTDTSSSTVPEEFSYRITSGPEVLLTPLDAMMPSPHRHARCRSSSNTHSNSRRNMESFRIPAHDISSVTATATTTTSELHNNTLVFYTRTGTRWEIRCETRNAHDLLLACLQMHVPCVKIEEREGPPLLEKVSSSDSSITTQSTDCEIILSSGPLLSEEDGTTTNTTAAMMDTIDDLTARCIQESAARESLAQKVERRWGKTVRDFQGMVSGAHV